MEIYKYLENNKYASICNKYNKFIFIYLFQNIEIVWLRMKFDLFLLREKLYYMHKQMMSSKEIS